MKLPHVLAALLLPLLVSAASADVVANYTFVNSSPASTDTDPSTAGNFTVYVGNSVITTGNGGISGTSMGGAYLKANADYATGESGTGGAVSNGTYFAFTITPADGTTLNLTSLSFELGGTSNNQTSFTVSAFLRTSLDNFVSDTGTVTSGSLTYSVPQQSTPPTSFGSLVTIDLSSLTSITATTTFEIYVYSNTNNPTGVYSRINDVTLNATTEAIPEPATYALAIGASAGLLALCLRRRKA